MGTESYDLSGGFGYEGTHSEFQLPSIPWTNRFFALNRPLVSARRWPQTAIISPPHTNVTNSLTTPLQLNVSQTNSKYRQHHYAIYFVAVHATSTGISVNFSPNRQHCSPSEAAPRATELEPLRLLASARAGPAALSAPETPVR